MSHLPRENSTILQFSADCEQQSIDNFPLCIRRAWICTASPGSLLLYLGLSLHGIVCPWPDCSRQYDSAPELIGHQEEAVSD